MIHECVTIYEFLEAQRRNRRETVGLVILFVVLCMLGGSGVDTTLMAGMGNVWFSFFGIIALAFLVPLFYAEWNGHRAESSQYSSE